MTTYLLAVAAGIGVHLLVVPRPPGSRRERPRAWRRSAGQWMRRPITVLSMGAGAVGGVGGFVVCGGVVPAVLLAAPATLLPGRVQRRRREHARRVAHDGWPALLEEARVQIGSLGRSIPHALFDVGTRAPAPLRPAFSAAHREWLLTTDLARALEVLRTEAADPTCDIICETLLVAHEVGGTDVDRRLATLAEDRRHDVHTRKDARSRLAGARFARRFVVAVPGGMALAGMTIGNGRRAYATPVGQVIVVVALLLVAACWAWAGRLLHAPEPARVFTSAREDRR